MMTFSCAKDGLATITRAMAMTALIQARAGALVDPLVIRKILSFAGVNFLCTVSDHPVLPLLPLLPLLPFLPSCPPALRPSCPSRPRL